MPRLFKDIARWLFWYPCRWLAQRLSLHQCYRLCRVLAALCYALRVRVGPLRRHLVFLQTPPPAAEDLERQVRRALWSWLCNEIEVFRFPTFTPATIDACIRCEGLAHLDRALEQDRGALLIFAHFGANQMVMPALGHRGYVMNQLSVSPLVWNRLAEPGHESRLRSRGLAIRLRLEQALPVAFIDVFASLREAFRCLQRNEILGVAIDGGAGKNKLDVPFLGRRACLSAGYVQIARRARCPVLAAFVLRGPDGVNTVHVEPAWPPPAEHATDADDREYLGLFMLRLEDYVRRAPCHYANFMVLRENLTRLGEPSYWAASDNPASAERAAHSN